MYIPAALLGFLAVPVLIVLAIAWYHESFTKSYDRKISDLHDRFTRVSDELAWHRRQILILKKQSTRKDLIRSVVEGNGSATNADEYLAMKQLEYDNFMKAINSDEMKFEGEDAFPEVERLIEGARERRENVWASG